ncbi:SDR family oxidoreductase [Catenulispora rubra]|uniref:SDR family oxidoreductase n=1 Tax=Catenulispora rubra TaxID=280293 RepID=UPI0018920DD4|nr:SDR family oxidoreductase [Catenulispora rubra]
MEREVLVVVGAGGMGQDVAQRIGSGLRVLLADVDASTLDAAAARLGDAGYSVTTSIVDVTSRESVSALARHAESLGPVTRLVHTAGLSPVQASVPAVLAVDLLGVALVTDEFGSVIASGGAGVIIASMSGYFHPDVLTPAEASALRSMPADDLLSLPVAAEANFKDAGMAYSFAKFANRLRVQGASRSWGERGARINSVSPGVISTAMGRAELDGPSGARMRAMVDGSAARSLGTPEDIAVAVDFLLSPAARFISGTDLLVDGGAVAAVLGAGFAR